MFTSAIGERTVRQGKEPDFSESRDPLMQRVQPASKRHFCLGAANGCHFMCSKLHKKISVLAKELKKISQVLFPFCSTTKIWSAKQFPTQLSCQAVGAALVSAGSSWVPHSWKPHQRHHLSIWPLFWSPAALFPRWVQGWPPWGTGSPALPWELKEQHPPTTEPGSMFVNTVRLPGLECGFFGDLHLFESSPQGFPRIPFHLAEAQCSFNSFPV